MDVQRQDTVLSSLQGHTGLTLHNSEQEEEAGVPLGDGGTSEALSRKRRTKTKIIWRVYAKGKGWVEDMLILLTIARQECAG